MKQTEIDEQQEMCAALGLDEEPIGMACMSEPPDGAKSPKEFKLPTFEEEQRGEVDVMATRSCWSCVLAQIRVSRNKRIPVFFDERHWGCLGGALFLGYNKKQLEWIVSYVSDGIPGVMEGERYFDSRETARRLYGTFESLPRPEGVTVFQPVSLFEDVTPSFVTFFARPEVMSGVHQLTSFVTGDLDVVRSPMGAGCTNIVSWPRKYEADGLFKAVVGGWDPSERKFLKPDELHLTVPWRMYEMMLAKWRDSFLKTHAWEGHQARVQKSRDAWGVGGESINGTK